jgi:hypothetical protein
MVTQNNKWAKNKCRTVREELPRKLMRTRKQCDLNGEDDIEYFSDVVEYANV